MKGIYQILYKNKCAYIGSSLNMQRRFSQHKQTLKNNNHRNFILQRMWNKNKEEFRFDILEEVFDENLLMEKEQYYIDILKPFTNLSKANGSHYHTEETKKKMRGRIISDKTRKLMSERKKGKPNGRKGIPTHRIPRSAFKKGLVPWNKGLTGYSTSYKGAKLSDEHKKKLSQSTKNNWADPEYRQMMTDAHKGE
jgi:group I intron endonuclease